MKSNRVYNKYSSWTSISQKWLSLNKISTENHKLHICMVYNHKEHPLKIGL